MTVAQARSRLTPTQMRILCEMVGDDGAFAENPQAVAEDLGLAGTTVKRHIDRIERKLRLPPGNRSEIALRVEQAFPGLIVCEDEGIVD